MSTLFFIRHGQASFGREDYDKLSDTGKLQSHKLAGFLHNSRISFKEIYSGTLRRHRETVNEYISASKLLNIPLSEVIYDERLNEYDAAGILKVLIPVLISEKPHLREHADRLLSDRKSFQIIFSEVMNMWCSGKYDMHDVMTWTKFTTDVYSFIDERITSYKSGENIALFTSGGPISVMMMKVLSININTSMIIRDQIVNSSITRFNYTEEGIMLASFNEYPHLELSGEENIITYR